MKNKERKNILLIMILILTIFRLYSVTEHKNYREITENEIKGFNDDNIFIFDSFSSRKSDECIINFRYRDRMMVHVRVLQSWKNRWPMKWNKFSSGTGLHNTEKKPVIFVDEFSRYFTYWKILGQFDPSRELYAFDMDSIFVGENSFSTLTEALLYKYYCELIFRDEPLVKINVYTDNMEENIDIEELLIDISKKIIPLILKSLKEVSS